MRRLIGFFLLALAVAGCRPADEVSSYSVKHEEILPSAPQEKVTLLAAMVPDGREAKWVFKVTGVPEAIEAIKPEFKEFIASMRFPEKAKLPKWKRPPSWNVSKGTEHREATILIPTEKETLDLAVSRFPAKQAPLLGNVNRWRGQIDRNPISEDELKFITTPIQVAGQEGHLIEMTGFRNPTQRKRGPEDLKISEEVPKEWIKTAAEFSKASYFAGDPAKPVQVTLSPFSGGGGGLLPNVNRWRRKIELEPQSPEEFKKIESQKIAAAGTEGALVDIANPESSDPIYNRIVAIMFSPLDFPDETWFLVMTGPIAGVEKELDNFKQYARSLRVSFKQ